MKKKIEKGTTKRTIARKGNYIVVMLTLEELSTRYELCEWDAENSKVLIQKYFEKKHYAKALQGYELLQEIILNTSFDDIQEEITESYRFVIIDEKDAE